MASGDAKFFEESVNVDKIRKLLDGRSHNAMAGIQERTQAMKWLLAMVSKGRDVSEFFPDVVKNIIVKSVEVKKLVYVFIMHYADHDNNCREMALLSVNSFQKDLADKNELIRALALRTMTSIRVKDIIHLQLMAVQKCTMDSSAYVRKTAAHALSKIYNLDAGLQEDLITLIDKLLNDRSAMVVGSAMFAYQEVCPDRYDLIHPIFRRLCNSIVDVDEWGQVGIISVLTRYARTYFVRPNIVIHSSEETEHSDPITTLPSAKDLKSFYDSGEDESEDRVEQVDTVELASVPMEPDHRMLLNCCLPLLRSRNSAVVLGVVSLLWNCGKRSRLAMENIVSSLVRLLFQSREVQYYALTAILPLAAESPDYFRPFLDSFFVNSAGDPQYIRLLKLDILTLLVTERNADLVLSEFECYVSHSDKQFVAATIRAVGRIVNQLPSIANHCLEGLTSLMFSSEPVVVAQSVVVTRTILQQHPEHCGQIRTMVNLLDTTKMGSARASIIWMTSEFIEHVPDLAPDALRKLCLSFENETADVKMQIVNLAVRLKLVLRQDHPVGMMLSNIEETAAIVDKLLKYVLELASFDRNYDLRDRVRLLQAVLNNSLYEDKAASILLTSKPCPVVLKVESTIAADPLGRMNLDSLSHVVGHAAFGYRSLPDWPAKKSNTSTRDAMRNSNVTVKTPISNSFYDNDSDDSDADSSSSSSSSSSTSGSSSDTTETGEPPPSSTVDETDLLNLYDDPVGNNQLWTASKGMDFAFGSSSFKVPENLRPKPLLSVVHGDGLQIDSQFSRNPSVYSHSMSYIILRITNTKSVPFNFVKVTDMKLKQGQQLVPFPEISCIGPSITIEAVLHIDFNGYSSSCKFSICSDRGTFPVSLEVPPGELFVPDASSIADFSRLQSRLSGMYETSKELNIESIDLEERSVRLKSIANVAVQITDEGAVLGAGMKLADYNVKLLVSIESFRIKVASDDILCGPHILDLLSQELFRVDI